MVPGPPDMPRHPYPRQVEGNHPPNRLCPVALTGRPVHVLQDGRLPVPYRRAHEDPSRFTREEGQTEAAMEGDASMRRKGRLWPPLGRAARPGGPQTGVVRERMATAGYRPGYAGVASAPVVLEMLAKKWRS
jgi:hypothetical protein